MAGPALLVLCLFLVDTLGVGPHPPLKGEHSRTDPGTGVHPVGRPRRFSPEVPVLSVTDGLGTETEEEGGVTYSVKEAGVVPRADPAPTAVV